MTSSSEDFDPDNCDMLSSDTEQEFLSDKVMYPLTPVDDKNRGEYMKSKESRDSDKNLKFGWTCEYCTFLIEKSYLIAKCVYYLNQLLKALLMYFLEIR